MHAPTVAGRIAGPLAVFLTALAAGPGSAPDVDLTYEAEHGPGLR